MPGKRHRDVPFPAGELNPPHQTAAGVEIMPRSEFATSPACWSISSSGISSIPEEATIEFIEPIRDHHLGSKLRDNTSHHSGGALKKAACDGDRAR